ncbi:hypothetical protein TGAM01_v201866 [Trichoderma gamsii]|uniref:C3H1-type domain-containing protein n=1 Tax=Trichoderma gamsii TaxID=398673 RepID=A0A2P4ZZ89_9HYPO|nr:hypothetical protein TGAM01_v201866 [Trichoderma gamsii]PON29617.1 hypothetical protein TGAM01_v201866 [Trichoderma gamsii]
MASPVRESSASSSKAISINNLNSQEMGTLFNHAMEVEGQLVRHTNGGPSDFDEWLRSKIRKMKERAKAIHRYPGSERSGSPAPPPTPPSTPPEDEQPDKAPVRNSTRSGVNCPYFLRKGYCPAGEEYCLGVHDEFLLWLRERQEFALPEKSDIPPPETKAPSTQVRPWIQDPERPLVVGSTCRSVTVSWPKPGKVAILGYGNLEMAKDECAKFNGDSVPRGQFKLICGHKVTATLSPEARPDEAPRASRVSSQVTVLFEPSVKTTDESLRRSIRKTLIPGPRQVTMGEYTATVEEMKVAVRNLLELYAPLELFQVFDDSTGTRLEGTAWFPDLVGALGAFKGLDKTSLPFYPEGQLSVRLHKRTEACRSHCGQ